MAIGCAAAACASTSSTAPKPIAAPTTPPAPAVNPFQGARFYVDPEFARTVAKVTAPTPEDGARLKKLAAFPTAVWLESLETAKLAGPTLDDALKQEAAGGGPIVPVFVVYNLPNRDCAAEGSRGELFVDKGGEALYQSQFIDVIAAAFAAHPSQKIAVVLEPDSLPNLVTNIELPSLRRRRAGLPARHRLRDQQAVDAQRVHLPRRRARRAGSAGRRTSPRRWRCSRRCSRTRAAPDRIRGFALNVSNYDPPREPAAKKSGPDDPSQDELGYADDLAAGLAKVGITGKGFIIDTSRNGKGGIRSTPGNWCNVKGAGLGERPTAAPAPNIDAYFWVKTPGESDGTADRKAARFDENCVSDDAMPGAPEAGELFAPYLIDLAKNANRPSRDLLPLPLAGVGRGSG